MLTGKYAALAELIGEKAAEKHYQRDVARAKKRDEIRQLLEQLLTLPAETVGTAYLNVIAGQCGGFDIAQPTETERKAEDIIFEIQFLGERI